MCHWKQELTCTPIEPQTELANSQRQTRKQNYNYIHKIPVKHLYLFWTIPYKQKSVGPTHMSPTMPQLRQNEPGNPASSWPKQTSHYRSSRGFIPAHGAQEGTDCIYEVLPTQQGPYTLSSSTLVTPCHLRTSRWPLNIDLNQDNISPPSLSPKYGCLSPPTHWVW